MSTAYMSVKMPYSFVRVNNPTAVVFLALLCADLKENGKLGAGSWVNCSCNLKCNRLCHFIIHQLRCGQCCTTLSDTHKPNNNRRNSRPAIDHFRLNVRDCNVFLSMQRA